MCAILCQPFFTFNIIINILQVQTDDLIQILSPSVNEEYLGKWLNNMYPIMAKELENGITNIFELYELNSETELFGYAIQTIGINNPKNKKVCG